MTKRKRTNKDKQIIIQKAEGVAAPRVDWNMDNLNIYVSYHQKIYMWLASRIFFNKNMLYLYIKFIHIYFFYF
jgi:hypothetical protein